ncbi:proline-rich protein 23A [Fukomys damarensis]|uniref:Proline-rich protein 23A n=1 Tax=Fukomys damarensis TaxID=885580 RepID=A0A091DQM4_FUKDA|nr:proline-rich protein 23A [Fukomys damarensis]KFO32758.1 Proline-rich protein 23A [Fukomys damarensis]
MMGIRPHSAGVYSATWSTPQPGLEDHAGPETCSVPVQEDSADPPAAPALSSMVILSEGCALQLPLDSFNLVVEAMPDSVLQVTLQDHTVILGPHNLLCSTDGGSGGQSDSHEGLDAQGACLGAAQENNIVILVEQQGFCASIPEMADHEEVQAQDDAHSVFLVPYGDSPAGLTAGLLLWPTAVSSPDPQGSIPEPRPLVVPIIPFASGSPGLFFDQDNFHLLRPFPTSPLQPLPPFPSPGPHDRPVRLGPHCKARRRLFQE